VLAFDHAVWFDPLDGCERSLSGEPLTPEVEAIVGTIRAPDSAVQHSLYLPQAAAQNAILDPIECMLAPGETEAHQPVVQDMLPPQVQRLLMTARNGALPVWKTRPWEGNIPGAVSRLFLQCVGMKGFSQVPDLEIAKAVWGFDSCSGRPKGGCSGPLMGWAVAGPCRQERGADPCRPEARAPYCSYP